MRIGCYPADNGGCGFFRMREPARAVNEAGGDVRILEGLQGIYVDDALGRSKLMDVVAPDVDVAVLQRPLRPALTLAIPHLQAHGIAVVVEVDDDFRTIDPANPAFGAVHPKLSPGRNWRWLVQAIRSADLVTTSTPELARRYASDASRVRMVRNYIPRRWIRAEAQERDVVGWTGSVATHPHDLQVTHGGVARAVGRTGARFRGIGSAESARVLGIDRGESVPWTSLEDYPAQIARLGVGIVPLDDTAFNRGKSWLKGLEYAACGVPFVATPLPEYTALRGLGAGEKAARGREWEREVARLLTDDAHHAERREAGLEAARGLTVEGHAHEWVEAWEAALDRRMGAALARVRRA